MRGHRHIPLVRGGRFPCTRLRRGGASILTTDPDFTFEQIRVRDLHKFACSALEGARDGDLVPLTSQRALAYSRNPYAGESDIGLIAAYHGGRCAGYLGIMPGRLLKDDALHPVHWFSTWFVPPEFRSAGVGLRLIMKALALRYDLVVTGTSREADRIYRGLGFREIGPLTFRRLKLPLPASMKRFTYGTLLRLHADTLREIAVQEVTRIQDEHGPSPAGQAPSPRFFRGTPVVNWMLSNRWIQERGDAREPIGQYAFSHTRDLFRYIALEIRVARSGEPKGYLVLSVSSERSRTHIKVLDFHAPDTADIRYVFPIALGYARIRGADQVDLPMEVCEVGRAGFLAAPLLRTEQRPYFCRPLDSRSPLAGALLDLRLDYCDGDTAFA